jgi:hypothetical protein
MNKVLSSFLFILLLACEQAEDIPPVLYPEKFNDPLNTEFNTRILDGFFVTNLSGTGLRGEMEGLYGQ